VVVTTLLTQVPDTVTAGDSVAVTLSLSEYPATAGWVVSLALAGPTVLTATATASGASHALALTAAQTSTLTAAIYQWRLRATLGSVVETFDRGTLEVLSDLGQAAAGEYQSYAEQMLAICRTARESILAGEMKMFQIGGRQVQMHTLQDVNREEAHWRRERARELRGSAFGKVSVGFTA
jgi:hypothetical protein